MQPHTLLLATAFSLGAVLMVQYEQGPRPWADSESYRAFEPRKPAQSPVAAKTVSVPGLEPLDSLVATIDRPIFSRSRRPAPGPQSSPGQPVDPQTPPAPFTLSLSAIVIDETDRAAYFSDSATGRFSRVAQGGEVAGWALREVRQDAVVLERNGQSRELQLRTYEPAPGAVEAAGKARQEDARARALAERKVRNAARSGGGSQAAAEVAATPISRPRRPLQGPRREAMRRAKAARNAEKESQQQ